MRADLREEQRITLGREDWPEYAWSFPIGDGRANIGYGAVLREGRPLSRSLLLSRLEELLPGVCTTHAPGGRTTCRCPRRGRGSPTAASCWRATRCHW